MLEYGRILTLNYEVLSVHKCGTTSEGRCVVEVSSTY
jgi:hypothetical protein